MDPLLKKLATVHDRRTEVGKLLADPAVIADQPRFRQLSREYKDLEPVEEAYLRFRRLHDDLAGAEEILRTERDSDLLEMARAERDENREAIVAMEEEVRLLLVPKDPNDARDCIVEVRAGTGGDEASLFAGDLYRMYERYCQERSWQVEVMDVSEGTVGGYKEVIFRVAGDGAYGTLKFEAGVHRVQRVPVTESQGRIHTSAAGVLVFPETEDVEITIDPNDLRIDVYRSSGPGGQSVNTTDSAVRITHVPTGVVVSCQNEKSQLQNKEQAMRILRARLVALAEEQKEAEASATRKEQVRTVDRSERIRTYNFPENRLSDHRTGFKAYNLETVLAGELDPVIQSCVDADLQARLESAESM